jgi:hypothetical protein
VARAALLEGVPTACSALPPVLEDLERSGLDVPVFDPYDIDAIASTLEEVLERAGREDTIAPPIDATWADLVDELLTTVPE